VLVPHANLPLPYVNRRALHTVACVNPANKCRWVKYRLEVNDMELMEEEKEVVCHALGVYLSDLRQEIVKTEKHDMKVGLHREKDVIENFVSRC
jgi:hypothetical protein